MSNDSLGDRMKSYEGIPNIQLTPRMPCIIRIDGKAFHSYTKDCKRPFDKALADLMDSTMLYLCENVATTVFGYVQSDEISLLLHNYRSLGSQAWFDNKIQKICSVSASMAAAYLTYNSYVINQQYYEDCKRATMSPETPDPQERNYCKLAAFDARVFVLPENEVANYFIWRQQDATRNSIQMAARALYSHSECNNKNQNDLQEMIFQKGINWNDYAVGFKRGRCAYKVPKEKTWTDKKGQVHKITRQAWEVDLEMPVITQNRDFVERHLAVLKEE